jgi:hypothetical protein
VVGFKSHPDSPGVANPTDEFSKQLMKVPDEPTVELMKGTGGDPDAAV